MKRAIAFFILGVIVAFAAVIGFVTLSPTYDAQVVRSESMKPTLQMGDVVITGPVGEKVMPGRIISFLRDGELVTHRVLSVEGGIIQTKGDALEDPDPWQVPISEVEGVFLFKVPFMGFLTAFLQSPLGWAVLVILPAALLIGYFMRDMFRRT